MKADYHMHTRFSADSDNDPEELIKECIRRGLKTICITDHHDIDFVDPGFVIDFEPYFETLRALQEKYRGQIEVLIGMEYGLQAHLGEASAKLAKQYDFDFILGSVHMVDGDDPYYRNIFKGRTDEEVYRIGFSETLESIKNIKDFDSLGHLDYIVRYGTNQEQDYVYAKYADYLDEILKHLIYNGKGLEVNTAGWKYGLSFAHPHQDVLKRYKELGGEILTVGSDAHLLEHLAYDFDRVKGYLEACGFKYYTEFRQRKPYFCAL
jgi:histidinol-phosphatase (PHP family)